MPSDEKVKEEQAAKEVLDCGPPPAIKRRQLIFDSLRKITNEAHGAGHASDTTGGTYVYTWGAGYHGQLGRKFIRGQKKYASVPQYVHFSETAAIRTVACGGLHTAAVSDDGQVYTWGDGRAGQLGQIHEGFVNQPTPRVVRSLSAFVIQVACGQGHTVALTNTGKLYSWGYSRFGQTGHGDRQQVKVPKLIDTERKIEFVQISCGDKHTVALTRHGKCFSFGCGEHGQLGHGDQNDQLRPMMVKALMLNHILSTSCGAIFSTFITETGDLYACGFGEYFYQNTEHNFMYTPRRMQVCQRVSQVSAGQSHVVILTVKGDVYCLGAGEYGQLGHGVRGNLSTPRLVLDSKNIVQVSAGRYHSLALTSFGAVFSWGNNDNGQLGQDTDDNVLLPRVVEDILGGVVGQIGCGEHHTVALSSVKWSKLGADVQEWVAAQKQEELLKTSYLKKTNYGLGKKELGHIREEMTAWLRARQKQKQITQDEEHSDTKYQVKNIGSKRTISMDIMKQMSSPKVSEESATVSSKTKLEVIHDIPEKTKSKRRIKGIRKKLHALISPKVDLKLPLETVNTLPAIEKAETARQQSSRSLFLKESAKMVTRMTGALTDREEANPEYHMKQTFAIVCALRKEYDSLKSVTAKKAQKLSRMQREVKYMSTTAKSMKALQSQYEEKLKGLEMQLDTVTIKINETEENRKNYDLNIAHLKEEELDRFFQMEALRKQRAEINALYRKMTALKTQAEQEQEQAGTEFEQFQEEIVQFHEFATEQLQNFQQVFDILQNQRQERQTQKETREQKTINRFSGRISRLMKKVEEKDNEAAELSEVLDDLNEQISFYRDRFQRISAATGLENPQDIVNKFYLKEEIKLDLKREIEMKKKKLEEVQNQKSEIAARLEEERSNFSESRWRDVDQLQEQYREAASKAEQSKTQSEKVTRRLAFLQEGTTALLDVVSRVQGDENVLDSIDTSKPWKPEEFRLVLKTFEKSIMKLKDAVESGDTSGEYGDVSQGLQGIPYMPADAEDKIEDNTFSGRGKTSLDGKHSIDPGAATQTGTMNKKKSSYSSNKKQTKKNTKVSV